MDLVDVLDEPVILILLASESLGELLKSHCWAYPRVSNTVSVEAGTWQFSCLMSYWVMESSGWILTLRIVLDFSKILTQTQLS